MFQSDNYVTNSKDCDDTDEDRNPSATQSCSTTVGGDASVTTNKWCDSSDTEIIQLSFVQYLL